MDEKDVDYSAARASMDRGEVSVELLLHGINNPSGRIDDPCVDGAFILSAVVDEGLPIDIHCLAPLLEERYCVMNVLRRRD